MWTTGIVDNLAIVSSLDKNVKYPKEPKDMFGELFEQSKGIPMPDFLKQKYYDQKGR